MLAATVSVAVFDNCDQPVNGQTVELVSSRGSLDTIMPLTQMGNQFVFLVRSTHIGAATLTATINPLTAPLNVTQTGTANFVCVNGSGSPLSFTAQDVQFSFTNPQNPPAPLSHSLRTLMVTWDDQNDTRLLMTIKMGATLIWKDPGGVTSPFTANVTDWQGGANNRIINPGMGQGLTLVFNAAAAGGTYTLSPIIWDDGSGGNICASLPASVTR